jgi:hypothetical protein
VKEGGGSSSSSKDPKGVKKDMTKKKEKWSESESLKVATAISLAGVAKGFSILHDRFVVDEIACACDAGASELLFVIFSAALLWIDLTVSQLYLSICIICIMQYGNVVCSLVVSRILYKTVFKISCSFFACDL